MKEAKTIPPVTVKTGPLLENVSTGKDIDIQRSRRRAGTSMTAATTSAPAAW